MSKETIRVLILNNARAEVERLISMLHASNHPCRAHHVESEENLTKLLQDHSWDLLIASDDCTNPSAEAAIKHIRRLHCDVPVILQSSADYLENPFIVVEGLRLGATDVVNADDDQHLLLVIDRELANRRDRKAFRNAERRLREAEKRSQQLLDNSRDAIAFVQDGLYLYANDSFAELFGFDSKTDVEDLPIMDMVSDDDQTRLKHALKEFTLKGDEAELSSLQFTAVTQQGALKPICLEISLVTYDEEPCIQFLARNASSITTIDNSELEAQLLQIKWQDVATGAYNRQYMLQQLDDYIQQAGEADHASFLLVELNDFNELIHQSFGAASADLALMDIATLLRAHIKDGDALARLGDTSFAILLPKTHADVAVNRAQDLADAISHHIIEIDMRTMQITATIGVAIVNENTTDVNHVLEQARSAADKARSTQVSALLFEPEGAEAKAPDMVKLLQYALANDRFHLVYQPIISLRDSADEYYEVYLRLLNEQDEPVSPVHFLEAAAAINAITKIDRWVILESIKNLARQRANGGKTKLIVKLSPQSLCDESLLPWLRVAFKAADLSTDAIVFQSQEMDVNSHLNAAKALAEGLEAMGSSFSISNFGCALNPFATLNHVPARMIKLDGSFTMDIQKNHENPETLTGIIKDLSELQKITVVPFVENASILSILWQAGTHYIQGNYLQEPSRGMTYDFSMES